MKINLLSEKYNILEAKFKMHLLSYRKLEKFIKRFEKEKQYFDVYLN